jgi:DNA-binding MarR family transcriptional regulator
MTPGQLAAADRLQPQSVTRVVAGLERGGLVARRRAEADGRQVQITITELGLETVVQDLAHWDTWLATALAQELSPTERELLRLAALLMERLSGARLAPISS